MKVITFGSGETNCGNNLLCTMCFTEYACGLKECIDIMIIGACILHLAIITAL